MCEIDQRAECIPEKARHATASETAGRDRHSSRGLLVSHRILKADGEDGIAHMVG